MSLANLQEHKEALRARLLADEKVRGRIAFRAFEIYQRHGDGHGGALDNWLQAEDEVVSSLIEQEFQLSSASRGPKRLKVNLDETPKPRVKPGKKAQPPAASVSDTASKRKAKIKEDCACQVASSSAQSFAAFDRCRQRAHSTARSSSNAWPVPGGTRH
jgi:DUF2934 family protein